MPFFVATKMNGMKPALFCPTPDDYVRSVLKKVGVTFKCHGYWPHELQVNDGQNTWSPRGRWYEGHAESTICRIATFSNFLK